MKYKNITVEIFSKTGEFEISFKNKIWRTDVEYLPRFIRHDGEEILLLKAGNIRENIVEKGYGWCTEVTYSDYSEYGMCEDFRIETKCWIDNNDDSVHFEIWTVGEVEGSLKEIQWPGAMKLEDEGAGYSTIPMMQGCIIPSGWQQEILNIEDGRFYSRDAYMPWFGQTDGYNGYIAISETPWDAGYRIEHNEKTEFKTILSPYWLTSLGSISYNRSVCYKFMTECDYNNMAKVYRKHAIASGNFRSLREKAIRNPVVEKLFGTPVVHTNIYRHVVPESSLYDNENIANNDVLTSFEDRANQLRTLKEKGVDNVYMHLDGWGKMGYDNQHPDVLPPCEMAGGFEGMKLLSNTCQELGYIFATHDQYRDYFFDAATFDIQQAILNSNGENEEESTWDGGRQTHLCTTFAPHYVRRNFGELKRKGIRLEGTYLDVFAVIEMDECFHPNHRMTRKVCMEKRAECFEYVRSTGIICSSEEPCDWSVPYLDLVHHGPHALSPNIDKGIARGIPVPLFNLVYHECMILPWSLGKSEWGIPDGESAMLYGLLNGGTGYLSIEADKDEIEKNRVLCMNQKKLVHEEMVRHEFLSNDYKRQRTIFSDGTVVEVDFGTDEYKIIEN